MASSRVNSPVRLPSSSSSASASSASSEVDPHSTVIIIPQPLASEKKNPAPSFDKTDPLLSNLSPESTLQALSSTNAVPTKNEKVAHDILQKSIARVSSAERALCIRAAVAAQKLGLWYKEVQAWPWPKGTEARLGKWFIPPPPSPPSVIPVGGKGGSDCASSDVTTYYGNLPADVVERCQRRIEEIRDGIDSLGVEELKEHVLNAHIPYRSRPSSSTSTVSVSPPLSYVQLSDFTAVITATILRALPLLSRLNSLLSTWDVRLLVLRQIPGLLAGLKLTRLALDSSFTSLRSTELPKENDALYSRANFRAKQAELEAMVVAVGRRIDRILDALEGREDSLPESWIDDLEAIETDFSNWVVEAERRTVANEWIRMTAATDRKTTRRNQSDAPDESNQIAPPLANRSDTMRQNGRTPMETIDEEPGCCPEPISNDIPDNRSVAPAQPAAETTPPEPSSNVLLDNPSLASAQTTLAPTGAVEPSSNDDVPGRQQQPRAAIAETAVPPTSLESRSQSSPNDSDIAKSELDCEAGVVEQEAVVVEQEAGSAICETEIAKRDTVAAVAGPVPDVALPLQDTSAQVEGSGCEYPSQQKEDIASVDLHDGKEALSYIQSEPTTVPGGSEIEDGDDSKHTQSQLQNETFEESGKPTPKGEAVSSISPVPTPSPGPRTALAHPTSPNQQATVEDDVQPSPETEHVTASVSTEDLPVSGKPKSDVPEPNGDSVDVAELRNLSPLQLQSAPAKPQEADADASNLPQHKLDSPIKLSKPRSGRLGPEKAVGKSRRRASNASDDSLSDYPSLMSSPEVREAGTASSNGTPVHLETPPQFRPGCSVHDRSPPNNDHTLRAHRLLNLESQRTSPNTALKHSRTVSLPLQRFIDERFNMNYEGDSDFEMDNGTAARPASSASFAYHHSHTEGSNHDADLTTFNSNHRDPMTPRNGLSTVWDDVPAGTNQRLGPSEGIPATESEASYEPSMTSELSRNTHPGIPGYRPQLLNLASYLNNPRINKRLKPHPSLEDLGLWRPDLRRRRQSSAGIRTERTPSRSSTNRRLKQQPRDRIDEQISSILTNIPARIHLVPQSSGDSPMTSSVAQRSRESYRAESPEGISSRSSTPAPSLFLTAAGTRSRRQSHSYTPEERSVRVYHLGDQKSTPTKLFIRSVGENSERLMVRVGGGWADLGEYLREYAIHHGHRKAAEVPRIEAEGASSQGGSSLARSTGVPSRPPSALSSRPPSPLVVRKSRRASNVSDVSESRARDGNKLAAPSPPMSNLSSRRRHSLSSNYSLSAASLASDAHASPSNSPPTSVTGPSSHSTPLGLAGPKPRSRRVTMTPESEAWVEDVLGQARQSSSLKPPPSGIGAKAPALPKVRSVSDIGTSGLSRRYALRGLNDRRV